ncbi:MAG TPA: redoxin family protein [Pirellulales bacterium]|nr:redoxin family protein [Pirellulales bacterium]
MQAASKALIALAALAIFSLTLRAEEAASEASKNAAVKIGQKVDDFTFKDIRYLPRQLSDFGEKKAFVIAFTTLDCPVVRRYLPRLKALDEAYRDSGVQFLAINVGPSDALREVAYQAIKVDADFPFAKDFDGQAVRALGAARAAEVVVLDGQKRLRYRGRVDSQYRLGGEKPDTGREDLKLAIDDVLAGREVAVAETAVDGCLISLPAPRAPSTSVTFAEHIAPLLQKHCQDCHHPGSEAPFALMSYEDAADHAQMIAEVVSEQRMPPWFASREHGEFTNRRGLTPEERNLVDDWVRGECKQGDMSKAPPARVFATSKWKIGNGTPDFILKTPVQKIPASGYIDYRYIILPHRFAADTWVQGVQILPSNSKAMHHCNMAHMKLGEKPTDDNFITGQVPGGDAMILDNHVGYKIPAGSTLMLQIHYVTTGEETTDQISVGLVFAKERIDQSLKHTLVKNLVFTIPPGAPHHKVTAVNEFKENATGYGLFTHMHVRGEDMTFRAMYPDGKDEMLLAVPNYSFDWQMAYRWGKGKQKFPKGTKIECIAHYDNSSFNPYNPDPKTTVVEGQQTFQEMMYGFVFFTEDNERLNLQIDPNTGLEIPQAAAVDRSARK